MLATGARAPVLIMCIGRLRIFVLAMLLMLVTLVVFRIRVMGLLSGMSSGKIGRKV